MTLNFAMKMYACVLAALLTGQVLSFVGGSDTRPNIVMILTDDQDEILGGLEPMKQTRTLLREQGITFSNAFATTPICCPSRSTILTGLTQDKHRVYNNSRSGGCGDESWQNKYEKQSLGPVMNSAGYRTFYGGKYLNQYGRHEKPRKPPGWDSWVGLKGNSVYYNYTLNINGTEYKYRDREEDYLTDVLTQWGLDFLKHQGDKPFFMVLAPPAPHEPFTPSRKYQGKFKGLKAPRTPNFNTGGANKHWIVRNGVQELSEGVINRIDKAFSDRWETLLSVDEMVSNVIEALKAQELLENTYIFLTSDHGYHLGQFSLPWDKRQPYDTDIRIPLVVRGPGVSKNITHPHPVLTIDFAPTFYDIAKVSRPPTSSGRSMVPLFQKGSETATYRRYFTVLYQGEGGGGSPCYDGDNDVSQCRTDINCKCFDARNNTYNCLRIVATSKNFLSCIFQEGDFPHFGELYDLRKDPYQLNNLVNNSDIL